MLTSASDPTDPAALRRAGRDRLSLALIDARNRSLRWAAAFEASSIGAAPAIARLRRLADFDEPADGAPGGPSERLADAPIDSGVQRSAVHLQALRRTLVDSLEATLDRLHGADETDAALDPYRRALHLEDLEAEAFAVDAQTHGIATGLAVPPDARPARPPLLFPAGRCTLGAPPEGFAPANERPAQVVALPEFEIDAQAVSWSQYGEFVRDGGYDEPTHWSADGWAWVQAQGRRAPRHVDTLREGVLQRVFGRLLRVPGARPAMHLCWYEADAWCRWAGRRLPSEAEWETAAVQGARRGFRWGEVREWTAGRYAPRAGAVPAVPVVPAGRPDPGQTRRALRGVSFAAPDRLRVASVRDGRPPEDDEGFFGFRSCAR